MAAAKIKLDLELGLAAAIDEALAEPPDSVPGMALLVFADGRILAEHYRGFRRLHKGSDEPPSLVDANTMWRIASISKPSVAIGTMRLVERGMVDPDADLSTYLGKPFRNPHYPDAAITARMLLSHTSSLRDADFYYPALGVDLDELLLPGGAHYADGAHFAAAPTGESAENYAPGRRYEYCNLGYGILGGILEKISGKRFDRFMREVLLDPLEIAGGFNVADISDERFGDLSPLYRKGGDAIDPKASWAAQIDDYPEGRPACSVRLKPGEDSPARVENLLSTYRLGSNGALFSPQGGLRISARDLAKIGVLLSGDGTSGQAWNEIGELEGNLRILKPESVRFMRTPFWRRDGAGSNAHEESRRIYETGFGLMRCDGPEGKPGLWGHHGDAYGFLGGLYLHPETRSGYLYLLGGTGQDPEIHRGASGRWPVWEERLQLAAQNYLAAIVSGFTPT